MSEELNLIRCGCGGKAKVDTQPLFGCYVMCGNCGMRTRLFINRAKAIEAWNRAMGERTEKVKHLERRSETSLSWEGTCPECGSYTMHEMNYCFYCGARLEWE